jgi:hypothetical protein
MRLGDLTAIVCDRLGAWNLVPLIASPYYRSYRTGCKKTFERYRRILKEYSPTFDQELDWTGFRRLARSLKQIDPEKMKTVRIEGGVIYDGHHRLAILLALHGPNYEL